VNADEFDGLGVNPEAGWGAVIVSTQFMGIELRYATRQADGVH